MTNREQVISNLAVPPGDYLAEVLDECGMSQADLGRRTGRPLQAINEIVKGEKAITPETALQLEDVLGVPAHVWTGLEMEYELVRARLQHDASISEEEGLAREFPYAEMARQGWVKGTQKLREKVEELRRFFGVSSLHRIQNVDRLELAFRKSVAFSGSRHALAAWVRGGELQARGQEVAPFDKVRLQRSLDEIRSLSRLLPEEYLPRLREILAGCGVAFVPILHLAKTHAQGATFWLAPDKAAVLISNRGKYADIFFFSLFHELAHILLHGKRTGFISESGESNDVFEQQANEFAAQTLIPSCKLMELRSRCGGTYFGQVRIEEFARELGISCGIVIGRLQKEKVVGPSHLNRLRDKLGDHYFTRGGEENGKVRPQ